VKSTVETLSPTRVRLEIEVPFAELEPSLKKAYREIGSQVSIPGFRRGKVPSAVIDQRVGRGAVLNEAVQEVIPTQILAAVREHEVKTLGRPEVEITEFADGQPLKFTAEVDVRPEIALPDLNDITVTVDALVISEDDVEEQLKGLRDRFATLKTVERTASWGTTSRSTSLRPWTARRCPAVVRRTFRTRSAAASSFRGSTTCSWAWAPTPRRRSPRSWSAGTSRGATPRCR